MKKNTVLKTIQVWKNLWCTVDEAANWLAVCGPFACCTKREAERGVGRERECVCV